MRDKQRCLPQHAYVQVCRVCGNTLLLCCKKKLRFFSGGVEADLFRPTLERPAEKRQFLGVRGGSSGWTRAAVPDAFFFVEGTNLNLRRVGGARLQAEEVPASGVGVLVGGGTVVSHESASARTDTKRPASFFCCFALLRMGLVAQNRKRKTKLCPGSIRLPFTVAGHGG